MAVLLALLAAMMFYVPWKRRHLDSAAAAELCGREELSMRMDLPQNGDVVVGHPTASIEHSIRVIPDGPHGTCPTHEQAVARGRELAERLQVDAWLTEGHCHFVRMIPTRAGSWKRAAIYQFQARNLEQVRVGDQVRLTSSRTAVRRLAVVDPENVWVLNPSEHVS
jgi:hypothetical protein